MAPGTVAFRLGIWFYDHRAAALAQAVQSFCSEVIGTRDALGGSSARISSTV